MQTSRPNAFLTRWTYFTFMAVMGMVLVCGFTANSWARLDLNDRPPSFSNDRPDDPDTRTPYDAAARQGTYYFYANPSPETTTTGYIRNAAFKTLCNEGDLTARIVGCITNVIDLAVMDFLEDFSGRLAAIIVAAVILAMVLFGVQMLSGQLDQPENAAFMLALKIGGVILFTNGTFGGFFLQIFPAMESLAGYAMSYVSQDTTSVITSGCATNPDPTISIWERIDCILRRLFIGGTPDIMSGLQSDRAAAMGGAGVLWVLAVAIFWTNFLGVLLFFVMLQTFLILFFLVVRCMYVFLACYCYLALLIVVSPLIIPLLLFRTTSQYFDKWFRQFVSMIIQPMILFAFMAFFFAVLDQLFFVNNGYSLMSILGIEWETPRTSVGYGEESDIQAKLDEFEASSGFDSDSPEYEAYETWLRQYQVFNGVGDVNIEEKPLIDIKIEIGDDIPGQGLPVLGTAIEQGVGVVEGLMDWGMDKLRDHLFPFKVPKVVPRDDRDVMELFVELLKFFLTMAVLLPLMNKFAQDIPRLMQFLSGARRTPGAVMPGERQVMGAIGAVKGATVGAVKGAVKGAITGVVGGPKGMLKGAAKGAATGAVGGAVQGYKSEGGPDAGGKKRSSLSLSESKGDKKGGGGGKQGDGTNPIHNQHLGDWGGMRGVEKQARKFVNDKTKGAGDKLKMPDGKGDKGGDGGGDSGGGGGMPGGGMPGGGMPGGGSPGGMPGGGGGGIPGVGGGGGAGGAGGAGGLGGGGAGGLGGAGGSIPTG